MFLKICDFPSDNVQHLHESGFCQHKSLCQHISLSAQALGVLKNTNITIQTVFRDVSDNIAAAESCVTCAVTVVMMDSVCVVECVVPG